MKENTKNQPYKIDLIKLTERVLNVGLRPHLTKWQAKYRKWYNNEFIKKTIKNLRHHKKFKNDILNIRCL